MFYKQTLFNVINKLVNFVYFTGIKIKINRIDNIYLEKYTYRILHWSKKKMKEKEVLSLLELSTLRHKYFIFMYKNQEKYILLFFFLY